MFVYRDVVRGLGRLVAASTLLFSTTAVAAPVLDCSYSAPTEMLISESIPVSMTIHNPGTDPGYQPSLLLAVQDGLILTSASSLGSSARVEGPVECSAGGTAIHPITGMEMSCITDDNIYVILGNVSALPPNGPEVDIQATLKFGADVEPGQILETISRCEYTYGSDAQNNPDTDPPIEGADQFGGINAVVSRVLMSVSDDKIVTGPSNSVTWTAEVDVATGYTIDPVNLATTIPLDFTVTSSTLVAGTGTLITSGPITLFTGTAPVTGVAGTEVVVEIEGFVPQYDLTGGEILNPIARPDVEIVGDAVLGESGWEDPDGVIHPLQPEFAAASLTAYLALIEEVITKNGGGGNRFLSGDVGTTNLTIRVSDYYATLTTPVSAEIPGDLLLDTLSVIPTPTNISGTDPEVITWDLGSLGAGSSTNASYQFTVADTDPAGDPIYDGAKVDPRALLEPTYFPLGSPDFSEKDSGVDGMVTVNKGSFDKEMTAINGTPVGVNPVLRLGDEVTYRLTVEVANGALVGVDITDHIPTPLFDASEHGLNPPIGAAGSIDPIRFGPDHDLPGGTAISATVGSNNDIVFDVGTFAASPPARATFQVEMDYTVIDIAVADGLVITNLATAVYEPTSASASSFDSAGVVVSAPEMDVEMGIWDTDHPPPGWVGAQLPGDSSNFPLGLALELEEQDASDIVTLGFVGHNFGSGPAYDVRFRGILPPEAVEPAGGFNFRVTDGAGNVLTTSSTDLFGAGLEVDVVGELATDGSDMVVVLADVQLAQAVEVNDDLLFDLEFTRYAGLDGGTDFQEPDIVEIANIYTYDYTIQSNLTGNTSAAVAEQTTYEIVVTVPEGTFADFVITERLPDELSITANPTVQMSGPVSSSQEVIDVTDNGRRFEIDFGQLVNADDDNSIVETVIVTYNAVIRNVSETNRGDTPKNNAGVESAESPSQKDKGPSVRVEEPRLQTVVKADPNPIDGGDSTTITYDVKHQNNSWASYDVVLVATLPPELAGPVNFQVINGIAPTSHTINGQTLTVVWDTLLNGQRSKIAIDTTMNSVPPIGSSFDIPAVLEWTSRPGDPPPASTFDPESVERTGTQSPAYNDYYREDNGSLDIIPISGGKTLLSEADVTVGSIVEYSINLDVPEGHADNFTIEDILPEGMAFVIATSFTVDPSLTCDGAVCVEPVPVVTDSGRDVEWSLGYLENTDSDNSTHEYITLNIEAVVTNETETVRGATFENEVTSLGTTLTSPPVTVHEPELMVDFTMTPETFDAGDLVLFQTVISHTAASDATAFDMLLEAPHPPAMGEPINIEAVGCLIQADNTDPVLGVSLDLDGLEVGTNCTITWQAQVSDDASPGEIIDQDVNVYWTSLLGDVQNQSPYNDASGERTGNPSDPGLDLNDYLVTGNDTGTVLIPSVVKSFVSTDRPITIDPEVAVGETVVWHIDVELPEGTIDNLVVLDDPPPGIRLTSLTVDYDNFGGTVTNDPSGPVSGVDSGDSVEAVFGDTFNPGDNDPTNNSIRLIVGAVGTYDAAAVGVPAENLAELKVAGLVLASDTEDVELVYGEPKIEITGDRSLASAGDIVVFDLLIRNDGNGPACDGQIRLDATDPLIPLDPASDTIDNDGDSLIDELDETSLRVARSSQAITWNGCLSPGQTQNWQFSAQVDAAPESGTALGGAELLSWNTLDAGSGSSLVAEDDGTDNNQDGQVDESGDGIVAWPVTIGVPDLEVSLDTIDRNGGDIEPSDIMDWVVTVDNVGNGRAQGVAVTGVVDMPNGIVDLASLTVSQGTILADLPAYAVDVGDIEPGAFATVSFVITVVDPIPAGSLLEHQANYSLTSYGSGVSNDPTTALEDDPTIRIIASTDNPDGDCFTNDEEDAIGTDPNKIDSDDDGVSDCDEFFGTGIVAGFAPTDPAVFDTDGDGLGDGQEMGKFLPEVDTNMGIFVPDGDLGITTTDPNDADTDNDGIVEGDEDVDANGVFNDGETDPNNQDTDADGLQDGTELSVTTGHPDTDGTFQPDLDPSTTSDPLDQDTDDDGLLDGVEDADANGRADFTLGDSTTTGSGESDAVDVDTDDDGLLDGLELGVEFPTTQDTNVAIFQPDTDPTTTTNAVDTDTDNGGVEDGFEDLDADGFVDIGEIDPNITADDATVIDSDGDGLADSEEDRNGNGIVDPGETDPFDADTDDDGLDDGEEVTGDRNALTGRPTDPLLIDTDGDGLLDGMELGLTTGHPTDTDPAVFVPDTDPTTTTLPNIDDTDGDGLLDSSEDLDQDGAVDPDETDPELFDTDADGLGDGQERGLAVSESSLPTFFFRADDDPLTTTDPLDADTDDDGLLDGEEDENENGRLDVVIGGTGVPGAGETDPNEVDTDGDGIQDGTELGVVTAHSDTDTGVFVPDADPATIFSPTDTDTDDGGLLDGEEDLNFNGALDAGETDVLERTDDATVLDCDGDGLFDSEEDINGNGVYDYNETDFCNADTDNDGLTDFDEVNAVFGFATDPINYDSDDDFVHDGTEMGITTGHPTDTNPIFFIPDSDPATTTDPLDDDSDDDGLMDGYEDLTIDGQQQFFETAPDKVDTDDDGVQDGTEQGFTQPYAFDTDLLVFIPDADPRFTTDPLDDDSDDDGLLDGTEDADANGAWDRILGGTGLDGTGETSPTLRDSDLDGSTDGVELGLTAPEGDDTDLARFAADQDPSTTTNPIDIDTDNGGLWDALEDLNRNGRVDANETDPNDAADDATVLDSDDDGLTNAEEDVNGNGVVDPGETDPFDADTDDDGLWDGEEVLGTSPRGIITDPLIVDTDGDGLQDGTEQSVLAGHPTDTDTSVFQPDTDPTTWTDPTDQDHDDDGLADGTEDADFDGRQDRNETDASAIDSDGDLVQDGTELGVITGTPDTDLAVFQPDADAGTTRSNPIDMDTDDDGRSDGEEDVNLDGKPDITVGDTGTPGGVETHFLRMDTDDDGLTDGQEVGIAAPPTLDTNPAIFVADADPGTTTDPSDKDTDDGGVADGIEDSNLNGRLDAGEIDPNDPLDDAALIDSDGDGISDVDENTIWGTDPFDADTDDDGLWDGEEVNGFTDALLADTDGDLLQDGTEMGRTEGHPTDTNPSIFIPDADPSTVTDPLDQDTDDDGLIEGDEDANRNGAVDVTDTDATLFDSDGDLLGDGMELGVVTPPADTDLGIFVPDADPTTTTDPKDDDTDDDGLKDGTEDANQDGETINTIGDSGTPGSGETDPNDFDTDRDQLSDGLESGRAEPEGTGTDMGVFRPDTDPATTTDPLDRDTDNGGIDDGIEDRDLDGDVDTLESDPNNAADDLFFVDSDDDGLPDGVEDSNQNGIVDPGETDPNDADTDDDGLGDGVEVTGFGAIYGATDPLNVDTDGDGVMDGTEEGLTTGTPDTNAAIFVPDADPSTTTDPRDADFDDDGLADGNDEDINFDGAVDAGETDPTQIDTDGDGLQDGTELGLTNGISPDTDPRVFQPDVDPLTTTDPVDDDSDDDGLVDGAEDSNNDGAWQAFVGGSDSQGYGETDAQNADSDQDGIQDGTERGLTAPRGLDTDLAVFVPDADPATTTDPRDTDSDNGSVPDGSEDINSNGAIDPGEIDPNDPLDDLTILDSDGDGLADAQEDINQNGIHEPWETDFLDADTDDDGLDDGREVTGAGIPTGVVVDPLNPDTDNDGLQDGLELGEVDGHPTDTDPAVFTPDTDPSTTTLPDDEDTDDDGLFDGIEDMDGDGAVDVDETDPNLWDTDADFIGDGVEVGVGDADPSTTTDPLDDDTDDDGLLDGNEDLDRDGAFDGIIGDTGTPGGPETDPNNPDTDADALFDGLERGLENPEGMDTDLGIFRPDVDPTTTTDPADLDTDNGGVPDGTEDTNKNGRVDVDEIDPNDPLDDLALLDSDGDGLSDLDETTTTMTDPYDADTDDDGLIDSTEVFGNAELTPFGATNPLLFDTDGDGLGDGMEVGLISGHPEDTSTGVFQPDRDPLTMTDPNDDDTDDDCLMDGTEDANQDGRLDPGEIDPFQVDTDGDLVQDGTEVGAFQPEGDDTDGFICQLDQDPMSTTDPLMDDTDRDGILDGIEDANQDGARTEDETYADDAYTDEDCLADGEEDVNFNGIVDPGEFDPRLTDTDGDGLDDCTGPLGGLELQGGAKGCSATGGGGMFGPLALLGLLTLLRRRVLPAAALLISTSALAQDDDGAVDIQRFQVEPQLRSYSIVPDPDTLQPGIGGIVTLNYAYRPLQFVDPSTREPVIGVADNLIAFHGTVSGNPTRWFRAGLTFPFAQFLATAEEGVDAAEQLGGSGRTVGVGDLTLTLGFTPVQSKGKGFAMSLVPRFVFPTGSKFMWLGAGSFGVGGDLSLGGVWPGFRFAVYGGYLWRNKASAVSNLVQDDELRFGTGFGIRLGERKVWEIGAEFYAGIVVVPYGEDLVGDKYDPASHMPAEFIVAGMYADPEKIYWLRFGGGTGVSRGWGSPDLRLFASVGIGTHDPSDRDRDGIPDEDDACPDTPEDFDKYQDEDGCPEYDNDQDGVADVVDGNRVNGGVQPYVMAPDFGDCLNEPEDLDGYQDEDGCPDYDNDLDGIPDVVDGHWDGEGGVVQHRYHPGFGDCMMVPEDFNGVNDEDGCPDAGTVAWIGDGGREIYIAERIYFDYDRTKPREESYGVIDAVAEILKDYPGIQKVEIQGHTDARGDADYNRRLSEARAESVRARLIKDGIDPDRLVAKGYGEDEPRVEGADAEAYRANRRVQFIILEQELDEVPEVPEDRVDNPTNTVDPDAMPEGYEAPELPQ